jgi:kynureninase
VREAEAVESVMRERGVLASARGPALRLAPHYHSTAEDVDRALDLLTEVVAELGATA